MQTTEDFTGLGMPVFTAFGWAGEKTAQEYALSQLELFIEALHNNLPPSIRNEFSEYGLSRELQTAYLGTESDFESGVHVAFLARPISLEMQMSVLNKDLLSRALKLIEKDTANFYRLLMRLGPNWTLRVQQIHINVETGERGHYQDIYKDVTTQLDEEKVAEIFNKAAYLNGEEQWVTPIYLSQRIPSEQVAAMGMVLLDQLRERLSLLLPIAIILSGRSTRRVSGGRRKSAPPAKKKTAVVQPEVAVVDSETGFTSVVELKPLHIRRGFINLTPQHWPFFATNARTETRPVTVITPTLRDKNCAVWRLQPSEMARIVLSPRVQEWLEANFDPGDHVQVSATRIGESDDIEVILEAVDS